MPVTHPVLGTYQYPGALAKMSEAEQVLDVPAPLLGADNKAVYGALGLDAGALEQLSARGVIRVGRRKE